MLCPRQKHATKSLLVAKLLYRRTSSGDRKFKKSGGAKWPTQDFCISSISLGGGVGRDEVVGSRLYLFVNSLFSGIYRENHATMVKEEELDFFRGISRFVQMRTCSKRSWQSTDQEDMTVDL